MNNKLVQNSQIISAQQNKLLKDVLKTSQTALNIFDKFKNEIKKSQYANLQGLYKILKLISRQNIFIQQGQNVLNNLLSQTEYLNIVINQECNQQLQLINEIKIQLKDWLQKLHNISTEYLISLLDEIGENVKRERKFEYKNVNGFTLKQKQQCQAFQFNTNFTILFVGQQDRIKIYGFNNQKKLIITQYFQISKIVNLIWMKKQESLVQGCYDHQINIWNYGQKQPFTKHQIIQPSSKFMICLIMNENEDLLISGNSDQTIKFWKKMDLSWILQQILGTQQQVCTLSLNTSQNKLVSGGDEGEIKVIELQQNQQWIITQDIKTSSKDYKVIFINDNQFVFQQERKGYLQIFDYDQENQLFELIQQVKVQQDIYSILQFPIQFQNQQGWNNN